MSMGRKACTPGSTNGEGLLGGYGWRGEKRHSGFIQINARLLREKIRLLNNTQLQ